MPCSPEAVAAFQEAGVLFAPAKASNAGPVSPSPRTSPFPKRFPLLRLMIPAPRADAALSHVIGGVGTSGLEMSQNSLRMSWTRDKVDGYLETIMVNIHNTAARCGLDETAAMDCAVPQLMIVSYNRYARAYGRDGDYVFGANAAAFFKVAEAMIAQGIV